MIDVVPAAELGEPCRRAVAEVFADGFGPDFRHLSRDRRRLTGAFAHMLDLDLFWLAVIDDEPVGMAALTDGRQLPVKHDRTELRRHLGVMRGTIADRVFRAEFAQSLPERLSDEGASLEFIATKERFQGRGVGTALLSRLLALPRYRTYYIESVADTNTAALHLYRKLGFTEYRRRPVAHTWITGIHAYVSLKLAQPSKETIPGRDEE
jgi:ribosomal protein S18 acetylase RimI-like enzyme